MWESPLTDRKKKYFHKNTKVIFLIFMAKDCEFITDVFKGKNLKNSNSRNIDGYMIFSMLNLLC